MSVNEQPVWTAKYVVCQPEKELPTFYCSTRRGQSGFSTLSVFNECHWRKDFQDGVNLVELGNMHAMYDMAQVL